MTNKRLWFKLILTLTAPILLLSVVFIAAGYADGPEDDLDTLLNLSRTAAMKRNSGAPIMRAQGGTLVALWSDGIADTENTYNLSPASGRILLQSANESAGYWRPRITVHAPITNTLQEMGADPDFVFSMVATQPYTLHIVWAEGGYIGSGGTENIRFPKIEYMQCQVADDYNTCWADSINIKHGNDSTDIFRNPSIAQDSSGNLHVVWVDVNQGALYYSRSYTNTAAITWTTPSAIAAAGNNASNPDLLFANGRLHLVWDNKSSSTSQPCIKYIYDDTYTDDEFTADGNEVWCADQSYFAIGGQQQYKNGNPGNPQLAAAPELNSIFITFDMQGSGEVGANIKQKDEFGLFYIRSETNGFSWAGSPYIFDIPRQDGQNNGFSVYNSTYSELQDEDTATYNLQPMLVLSYTAPITWGNVWLHAVWHNNITDGEDTTFQVMHSRRVVNYLLDDQWTTPYTVSNPPDTSTPPGRAPTSPDAPAGESRDSVGAALAITNGGQGRLHAAFIEREKGDEKRWDVYYRGVIIGTIDPGYLQDKNVFQMSKVVDKPQGDIVTSANTIPSFPITYHISLNNSGTMNALGLSLSDTLPDDEIQSFTAAKLGGGILITDTVRKTISWTGTISRHNDNVDGHVEIWIYAHTKALSVPTTITNTVNLKNPGSKGEVALSSTAKTSITHYQIYLPIVMKQ